MEASAVVVHHEAENASGCGGPPECGFRDDFDAVVLLLRHARDVDARALGYRIRVVEGTAPEGLDIEGDYAPTFPGDLAFFGAGTGPLSFTLSVTPLDIDGNASEPVEVVVSDSGRFESEDSGGCSAGSHAISPWLLSFAGLALLRRWVTRR